MFELKLVYLRVRVPEKEGKIFSGVVHCVLSALGTVGGLHHPDSRETRAASQVPGSQRTPESPPAHDKYGRGLRKSSGCTQAVTVYVGVSIVYAY